MSRPENLTTDEAEIWQRMEQHGEELVRDMGAAMMQAERLPEWMQEAAVNMLCDKLADARALAASWMNDHGEPWRRTRMKSKIEINISVIDDGPVVMRCQGQNTSKGKALDALEDAYLSTVAQLMRKDLSKAEQEEAAKEFGEMMQDRLMAMVRGKGKRYMVSSEKEMSFMTELMRRQGEVQP